MLLPRKTELQLNLSKSVTGNLLPSLPPPLLQTIYSSSLFSPFHLPFLLSLPFLPSLPLSPLPFPLSTSVLSHSLSHVLSLSLSFPLPFTVSLVSPHSAKRCELQALGEQVTLLKEALTAKDQIVVDLTNQVFSLENKGQVPNE